MRTRTGVPRIWHEMEWIVRAVDAFVGKDTAIEVEKQTEVSRQEGTIWAAVREADLHLLQSIVLEMPGACRQRQEAEKESHEAVSKIRRTNL